MAAVDISKLPPPAARQVDFTTDIKPIFEQSCFRCHGPERPKSRFRLDNRAAALKGGEQNKDDIVPGNSAKSRLIHYVAGLEPDMLMPPEGKGEPLTTNQIALLRAWIDQGATGSKKSSSIVFSQDGKGEPLTTNQIASPRLWNDQDDTWGEEQSSILFSVTPGIGYATVSGNAAKFREHQWMRDGWRNGVEYFELRDYSSPDYRLTISGHALTDDYKADLLAEKPDLGFLRFGFSQFRKYDSDYGGYFPLFSQPITNLNQNLYYDDGRVWFDVGLTLPDWPRAVLGYEYQYRQGAKSTLQWGAVSDGARFANIYPAIKELDERTHILKFDVDYERNDWRFENRFRGEWTTMDNRHDNVYSLTLGGPDSFAVDKAKDGWKSFQGANTVRVEKQFNDWFYTSFGYLYSHLSADADFSFDRFNTSGSVPVSAFALSNQLRSDFITVSREAHVGNINALFGPWQGTTLTLGAQTEWSRQHGTAAGSEIDFAAPPFTGFATNPVSYLTDIDRLTVDESAALRYTSIPFTTLFGEARLQQERIGQYENGLSDQVFSASDSIFLRDTQARSDLFDLRAGFDSSPWIWMKFGSQYRWRDKSTDYDHELQAGFDPYTGYPAFITARNLRTHEIQSHLTLRPWRWLKTTFTHHWVATDYHTTTEPIPGITEGGRIFAGNYDAHIYSLNLTLTPWQRLNLFSTLSYQDIRSTTSHDYTDAVVPYRGDTWTASTHARYVLTKKTDLTLGYTFSTSDFRQDNLAAGVPLGIAYHLHGVQCGLISRWTEKFSTKLQYGFYRYTEPTSGGANDYTAHAIFFSLNFQFD